MKWKFRHYTSIDKLEKFIKKVNTKKEFHLLNNKGKWISPNIGEKD